ncbi:hypothetical protein AC791_17000 [Klebsiella sp. RIT-PI-d]|uniref:DUF6708 domain-containing protein n=1 Tax=Klebsiella sp. RIT-PI-d TaxID=1681196 RepID=UPI0006A210EA|nr:DUF6708 domain-containing protein [Klebsiella sp. RIT-PI-d]KNC07445.1 hypothetical protein AC791_17000 [Klebsiella sp. RIT-PI-d]
MTLFSFDEPQPKLNPPVTCWREDMPESHEPQLVPPQLRWLTTQNDIYLEVPRYGTEVIWGWMLFTAILMFGVMVFFVSSCFEMGFYALAFISVIAFSSLMLMALKMYFIAPRNHPIRLNRKRQRIYLFDYNRSRLPWLTWPVTITSYRWADVYAEISFSGTPGDRGYRLYGAVCTPGTYNVEARFLLAREWEEREQLNQIWSYLCIYMKHDSHLPPPRHAVPPNFWCPRKADKWPDEMERESTTAPEAEKMDAGIMDIWKALRLNPPT